MDSADMIYLLPTPLGNKEDITLRVLRLLRELPVFLCEHTDHARKLFHLYDIPLVDKKLLPLRPGQLSSLPDGQLGILSDAWLPGLSDPGKEVVRYCHDNNRPFTVIPWPSALPLAVVASAFDTHQFAFWGFVPHKKGRQTMLQAICHSEIPVFVFESVHRIHKTLLTLQELGFYGHVSLAREISKQYEQLITAPLSEILAQRDDGLIVAKGEFVLWFSNKK